jgi:hypothetical protein
MRGIEAGVHERLAASNSAPKSLEGAARVLVSCVYDAFSDAIVLARLFAILPRSVLPHEEGEHADRFARAAGQVFDARSPVLTLLATRGARPEWNDRRRSRGHLAVPLAPSARAPSSSMVTSLLDELGVRLTSVSWGPRLVSAAREVPEHPTYYVPDAVTTTDARGRFKIPARAFVVEHEVKTVFGVGGSLSGTLFVMVLFARQHVTRAVPEQLVPLAAEFRRAALPLATRRVFFDGTAPRIASVRAG